MCVYAEEEEEDTGSAAKKRQKKKNNRAPNINFKYTLATKKINCLS